MKPLDIALQEYGEWEWPGNEQNPRILHYFKTIGHPWVKDDETAWCAAFVNFCLYSGGKKQTGKLNARSFLTYGKKTEKPKLGDIVVLWRDTPKSAFGHVGFFIRETQKYIYILGGNQAQQVNISKYPKEKLLEYRSY